MDGEQGTIYRGGQQDACRCAAGFVLRLIVGLNKFTMERLTRSSSIIGPTNGEMRHERSP
jgi:hypothetical protein